MTTRNIPDRLGGSQTQRSPTRSTVPVPEVSAATCASTTVGSVDPSSSHTDAGRIESELRTRGVEVLDVEYAATVRLLLGSTDPTVVEAHVAALTGGTGTVERVGERWV